jgi:hypothetical protein
MVTAFRGALPPEAIAAVAKYHPYVVLFVGAAQRGWRRLN